MIDETKYISTLGLLLVACGAPAGVEAGFDPNTGVDGTPSLAQADEGADPASGTANGVEPTLDDGSNLGDPLAAAERPSDPGAAPNDVASGADASETTATSAASDVSAGSQWLADSETLGSAINQGDDGNDGSEGGGDNDGNAVDGDTGAPLDDEGPNPDGETVTPPLSRDDEGPLECVWGEIVDALECGTHAVRDATLCGTEIVTDVAQCGSQVVTDSAICGFTTVASAAKCGTQTITSAAQCGTKTITSAAQCGTKTITDGAVCGWENFLSLIGVSKKTKSCKVAKSCSVAKSCNIAKSCDVAGTCTAPKRCEVAATCDIANRCDVEICKQSNPGGQCIPGVAECDIEGFSCQASFDGDVFRCVPSYSTDLAVEDRAVCEALREPNVAKLAELGGDTLAFSAGTSAAVGVATSIEVGTVYGEGGEYGCFVTTCVGAQTDIAIADFSNLGAYVNWGAFAGEAKTFGVSGSFPGAELGVGTASVLSAKYDQYIGQVDTISLGVGIAPAQVTAMTCNTMVYQTR